MSLRRRALALVGVPLALVLVLVAALVALFGQTQTTSDLVRRHDAELLAVGSLLASTVDAETGVRGYLAGGREGYLEPFGAARRNVPAWASRIEILSSHDRAARPAMLRIASAARARIVALERQVRLVRAGRRAAALAELPAEKREMDRLRTLVDAFDRAEAGQRDADLARLEALWRTIRTLALAAVLPIAALSLVWNVLFARTVVRRLDRLRAKARRVGRGEQIGPPDAGDDEIAEVDRALHEMAAELAARQSALTRYRLLSEITRDVILFLDEKLTIVEANAAAAETYQIPRESLVGRSVWELHAEASPGYARTVDDALGAQGVKFQRVHRRADGSTFPAEIWARSAEIDGRRVTVTTIRDVTEREQARTDLVHALGEALEASRLKTEFVAMISHEIRTPMNGVIGMSELLLRTPLRNDQREYASTISESAHSLLAIVDDILDFSKMETGKLQLDEVDFVPAETIERVAGLLRPAAEQKGLSLVVDISPHLPPAVHGDAGRLRQILVNLVGNAVKFTDHGGVRIEARVASVEADAVVLEIAVRDTGMGIAPGTRVRLFEPFVQGDGSTTRLYGGTGLGLAICRRLVELMGGGIDVESAPGAGSTFRFTVRLGRVAAIPAPASAGLDHLRVLLVDDDGTARQTLSSELAAWGMRCDAVGSADEALAAVRGAERAGRPFGLVLLDYILPKANGFAVADLLRGEPGCAGAAFVLITAFDADGRRREALGRGFAAYLTKPFTASALHDAIAALGARDRRAAPAVPATVAPAPPVVETARLLLAEDNAVNQRVALLQLRELGFDADVVADGEAAVAAVREGSYDLVLMDVHMPRVDGLAAARRIRDAERESGRHVPIVALTADARERDREACLAAGMDDYLAKPLQLDALRAMLGRWLAAPPENVCS